MTREHNRSINPRPRAMSRRDFVKLAMAGLLAGCRSTRQPTASVAPTSAPTATSPPSVTLIAAPTAAPTSPPTATLTAAPTAMPAATTTALPTATATPAASATPIVSPPAKLSTVVQARHAGVWDGETLSPEAVRHMLDAAITQLTGENDARDAWASLFSPGERIAIKVNTIRGSAIWTHVPLVMGVTERLQEAGVPAEQIVIFDRRSDELAQAGYAVNQDGPGVRCYGADGRYTASRTLAGQNIALGDVLLDCDALINMPLLKQHDYGGISFAMKNHYGSFDRPARLHPPHLDQGIAELNALPSIKERTRLIIGDALEVVKSGWYSAATGDSILMSFDPVAHDAVGVQMYVKTLFPERELTGAVAYQKAVRWLENGAGLGLGAHDPDDIDWQELNLG